ncbi:MAG: hypothetical protein ASARMPREDX12_002082 [Alectoria sarmentosa]|nr:MAG: hypothetical protein ASARMPREDX12_002082 [Alectoria sarmentosa]
MPSDQGQKPWIEEEQSPVPGIQISNLHFPETAQSRVLSNINHSRRQRPHVEGSATIMLNAVAMKNLLSENVDENASHFAFFSRAGTIMGHDHAANVKAVKRFTAFAANTWAHNDNSLKETGHAVKPLTPGTTVLQAILKEDGRGLHCLIVQVDGLVGAVTHVREGTLLAALKGKEEFGGERDEVAGRIKGVEVAKGDQGSKGDEVQDPEGFLLMHGLSCLLSWKIVENFVKYPPPL